MLGENLFLVSRYLSYITNIFSRRSIGYLMVLKAKRPPNRSVVSCMTAWIWSPPGPWWDNGYPILADTSEGELELSMYFFRQTGVLFIALERNVQENRSGSRGWGAEARGAMGQTTNDAPRVCAHACWHTLRQDSCVPVAFGEPGAWTGR